MSSITTNKKVYYDYEVLQSLEAGIVLSGPEVKSIKNGRINLSGGYVNIDSKGAVWLINVHVDPYAPAAQVQKDYNPTQNRKLLLNKKEIFSYTKTKFQHAKPDKKNIAIVIGASWESKKYPKEKIYWVENYDQSKKVIKKFLNN